jgi:hypothetical protein
MTARININIADVRKEPNNESERISQGLFNELVEIVEFGSAMHKIRFPDGYEGWIGARFLSEHHGFNAPGPFTIISNIAPAFERPEQNSRRLTNIPYGCEIYGRPKADYLELSSGRYGTIYIRNNDFVEIKGPADLPVYDSANLIVEAEKFLGVPYLWGGRSFFGLDCSGFVGIIAARFGVRLPRDTKDQIQFGRRIERSEIRRGDLLFSPGHVALSVSPHQYIHSSRGNGGVAYNSLDALSPIYDENHDKAFLEARRIFS